MDETEWAPTPMDLVHAPLFSRRSRQAPTHPQKPVKPGVTRLNTGTLWGSSPPIPAATIECKEGLKPFGVNALTCAPTRTRT